MYNKLSDKLSVLRGKLIDLEEEFKLLGHEPIAPEVRKQVKMTLEKFLDLHKSVWAVEDVVEKEMEKEQLC
jgi:hypothetical protein